MSVKELKGFLRVAGPAICGILASAGVVVTAVLSAKGALKTKGILYNESLSKKEKIKAAAPYFAPAGMSGIVTVGFIVAANVLGEKQRAALTAGFLPVYKAYSECHAVKDNDGALDSPVIFYDKFSGRYFKRTMTEVIEAEYHLNRNFILRGYAPLNELYEFLGLDKTKTGEKLGWSQEMGFGFYGYEWIDFVHTPVTLDADDKGTPCYLLKMPFEPTDDYLSGPYDE